MHARLPCSALPCSGKSHGRTRDSILPATWLVDFRGALHNEPHDPSKEHPRMNAVAATNVITARASAPGAGRVARRATASRAVASTPRLIGSSPNTAVLRAGRVRCRAEGEEKDTMSSLDAILAGSEDKDAPVRVHAAATRRHHLHAAVSPRIHPSEISTTVSVECSDDRLTVPAPTLSRRRLRSRSPRPLLPSASPARCPRR